MILCCLAHAPLPELSELDAGIVEAFIPEIGGRIGAIKLGLQPRTARIPPLGPCAQAGLMNGIEGLCGHTDAPPLDRLLAERRRSPAAARCSSDMPDLRRRPLIGWNAEVGTTN